MLLLTFSGYCMGFNLPYNTQIQLDNGEFVSVENITDGDVVMVHDDMGHEQSAEAVNVSKTDDMVQFTVLDYNHFKSNGGWVYENAENDQDYVIVSSHKIKDVKKIKKVKRGGKSGLFKKLLPFAVGIATMGNLPVANALSPWCYGACVITCRTACAIGGFVAPPLAPLCFAVEATGSCELGCQSTVFFPC